VFLSISVQILEIRPFALLAGTLLLLDGVLAGGAAGQDAQPVAPPAAPAAAPVAPRTESLPADLGAPAPAASTLPAAPPAESLAQDKPEVVLAPGKGLTVTAADKRFQVTFRSRIQLRESLQHGDAGTTNEVQVRTLRFITQGYVLVPELKYLIQLAFGTNDFENGNSSPIFDAFVEYVKLRDLNVRIGQYFVPFDRARTIREFALQFVDRQIVVRELTLDRDMGLMFSSSDLGGLGSRLAYNLFVGGGDGRNRFADVRNPYGVQKPSVLVIGRFIVRPFGSFDDDQEGDLTRTPTPKLALGVAGGFNKASSRDHSTFGATYTQGTFDYAHGAADLVFKWHGFSLLAEGVVRQANRDTQTGTNADGDPVTEYSRSGFGYLVQAGQMVSPKAEATLRWDDLHARSGTDPALVALVNAVGRQLGAGVNYYLNGHAFKLQADYFYIFGQDVGVGNHALRAQLDASF
jgi:hypothetical protein